MLGNWIKQTTTTTGAGNLTLSASTGLPTFNAVFGLTRYFSYTILDASGNPVETGIGHLSAADTLVRDTVLATMVSGVFNDATPVAVNLAAGTYTVICSGDSGLFSTTIPSIWNTAANSRRILATDAIAVGTNGTLTLAANYMYLVPCRVEHAKPISTVYLDVTTGVAGNVRVGLYTIGPDGLPANLLFDSGSLSCASAVMISASVGEIRLPPARYFAAIISDAAPTLRSNGTWHDSTLGYSGTVARYINAFAQITPFTYGALPASLSGQAIGATSTSSSAQRISVWVGR